MTNLLARAAAFLLLAAAADAVSQTVIATPAVGTAPAAVVVDVAQNRAYVANSGSGSVSVLDGSNGAVLATIGAGATPHILAVHPRLNRLYVGNFGSHNVTVIDTATNTVVTTVAAGVNPFAMAVNTVTNRVFVANGGGTITVIDANTNAVAGTVTAGGFPYAVAIDMVANRVFVANRDSHNVTVINGATLSHTLVAVGTNPQSLGVNPATGRVYVGNWGANTVSVINGATSTVTATLAAGTNPFATAVDVLNNRVFVANGGGWTTVINGATDTVAGNPVASGFPFAVAVDSRSGQAIVANHDGHSLTIVDGATLATSSVPVGTNPRAVAVNPVTRRIFVANFGGNSVSLVDAVTLTSTTVAPASQDVAVNPMNNRAYFLTDATNLLRAVDGTTGALVHEVSGGAEPRKLGVNGVTGRVFVTNYVSASVHDVKVFDAAGAVLGTIPTGNGNTQMLVTESHNTAYNLNEIENTMTRIDGATLSHFPFSAGGFPAPMVHDPVLDALYGAQRSDNYFTMFSGATGVPLASDHLIDVGGAVAFDPIRRVVFFISEPEPAIAYSTANLLGPYSPGGVLTPCLPGLLAANPANGRVYFTCNSPAALHVMADNLNSTSSVVNMTVNRLVADPARNRIIAEGGSQLRLIDSATNVVTHTLPLAAGFIGIAVNPRDAAIFLARGLRLGEPAPPAAPATLAIAPLASNTTGSASPTFTFTTGGTRTATAVYYRLDSLHGPWLKATGTAPTFSGGVSALAHGRHTVYAFATYGEESGSNGSASPVVGHTVSYTFVKAPLKVTHANILDQTTVGQPYSLELRMYGGTPPFTTGLGTGPLTPGLSVLTSVGYVGGIPTQAGSFPITLTVTDSSTPTPNVTNFNVTIVIAQASQSIAFPEIADRAFPHAPFQIQATASSSLQVHFASTTPAVCSVTDDALTGGVSYGTVTLLAAGTCTIEASQAGNANYLAATPASRSFAATGIPAPRPRDLSGDGRSDILLRGPSGEVVAWLMNGSAISSSTLMLGGGTGFQATKFGDFNGDGKQDLLVTGPSGELVLWLMNGATVSSSALILGGGTGYAVDQFGDFNGDGKADILFKGAAGDLVMWLMDGATVSGNAVVLAAGTGFAPVATGDFDADGKSDLVIAHTDGRVTLWLMNGTAIASNANKLGAGTGFTVSHAADFDDDGKSDLLFKGASGEIVMWRMDGTTTTGSTLLYGGGPYLASHVADVNGDGMGDIVLKGPAGEIVIWQMNGAVIVGATLMYSGGPWQVTHVGDYNGDGMDDLLLKGPGGEIVAWIMNGSAIASATLLVGATTWAAMP